MKKFVLDSFKQSIQYFFMFDEIIKKEAINKDAFLKDIGINPSSYRRARTTEQKVGMQIIESLANYYDINLITIDEINEDEKFLNELFFDINYKVYDKYFYYLEEIENKINKRNLFFPIYKLFKLLLLINSQKDVEKIIQNNIDLFCEVKKFELFFGDSLVDVYELVCLAFANDISKDMMSKKHNNGMAYAIIATKFRLKNNFFESLYYAKKAKEVFLQESNYKRVIYINFTILNNLSLVFDYEEYYNLAHEQLLTLRSFSESGFETEMTIKHLVVAALALKKYDEVKKILLEKGKMTISEICCLIIAIYNLSPSDFDEWCMNNIDGIAIKQKDKELIENLKIYLKNPDKKNLIPLEDSRIMTSLINILKWA